MGNLKILQMQPPITVNTDKTEYYLRDMTLGNTSLLFCGYQKCPPGQFNSPHTRNHHLLVYICSGKGYFHTTHTSYPLSAGCTFCIFPGEVIYYQADETDPWEYYWIAFDGKVNNENMEQILAKASLSKIHPIHKSGYPGQPETLYRAAFELCRDMTKFTDLKIFSLFFDILHYYITTPNCYTQRTAQSDLFLNPYVIKALDYIRLHYREDISVSSIAEQLGISREYFSSIFTGQIHISPACFLREYRLKCSATLLTTTEYPVTQIAGMTGFHDYCYYSNQFHNLFGISPSTYRQHFRITGSAARKSDT